MFAAILLSALAMSLIVGARYLLASGAFALATRHRRPGLYTGLDRQIRREIAWSLASALIYGAPAGIVAWGWQRSEEHTSELQSLMRISYAVFCLKKQKNTTSYTILPHQSYA